MRAYGKNILSTSRGDHVAVKRRAGWVFADVRLEREVLVAWLKPPKEDAGRSKDVDDRLASSDIPIENHLRH